MRLDYGWACNAWGAGFGGKLLSARPHTHFEEKVLTIRLQRKICGMSWGFMTGLIVLAAIFASALGCDVQRRRSDAELGLNPQQAAGRKVYDHYCDRCHEPYSTRGKKGPGLKGVFKNKYLSESGRPANDETVTDIIRLGRKQMPAYSQTLSDQDLQNLLAYMHTL
jgi:mono/diheme cytochrome c family protein